MPQETISNEMLIKEASEWACAVQKKALKNKREAAKLVRYMLKEKLITFEDIIEYKADVGFLVAYALKVLIHKNNDNQEIMDAKGHEFMQRVAKL